MASKISAPEMTKARNGMQYTKIQNPEGCTIEDGAKAIKKSIVEVYDSLNEGFQSLAKGFNNIAASGVCGSKLKDNVTKVANKCKKQGGYCITRKNEMNELFKYSELESKINELENKLSDMMEKITNG